jgi:DNA polymerase-1
MPGKRPCLYLVDGSSYIYRAFHALPPLTSPNGVPTNAVYGFTTMLLKLLADTEAQHLVVVFDAPGGTFRDEMFDAYKANRPPTPDDLSVQIPLIHRTVEAFALCKIAELGVEADDVIATLVERYTAEGFDCVVITGDKDLMQLVGPHVRLWDTMRDKWIDEAAVEEKFGTTPEHVVDVLALMGDSVDNIPGVKGVGEKTAKALVQRFGGIDDMLERLDEVERMELRGAAKVAERLRLGADDARMSRALASLRYDVPLRVDRADFAVSTPDPETLRPLFTELGFQTLLGQLAAAAPPHAVEVIEAKDAADVAARVEKAGGSYLALAVVAAPGPRETTPAQSVLFEAGDGMPFSVDLDTPVLRESVAKELGRAKLLVGHDLKLARLRLAACGIVLEAPGFDLMVASYLVDPAAPHDLAQLAARLLGAELSAGDDRAAAQGAVARLGDLYTRLAQDLRTHELQRLFEDVEMPLVAVLAAIERRGMLVDTAQLAEMSREFGERLDQLMGEIHLLAGTEFNINSPPQLREILFGKLGLSTKGVKKGKTGYSTDVDVLTRLSAAHPLPAKILDYRMLSKLKSTYVDALPAAINPTTGRLHTTLNQAVAATGRLSSKDPNLQNIPVRGEEGRRIRQAFVAPPGQVLIAADYSQIELRVLAHLSADPVLIEAFRAGEDIHRRTAAEIFDVFPGTVTKEMRRAAKVINFGVLYGMGAQRLAGELGISMREAQTYIASYFDRYAGVKEFMTSVVEEARELGYARTILGRRRPLPELRSHQRGIVQAAERVAANTPIQGSAADLIKLAMVAVERRLGGAGLDARMILQIHDELLFEAAESDCEAVCEVVREEMEGVMELAVALPVDLGVGRSWAEAH